MIVKLIFLLIAVWLGFRIYRALQDRSQHPPAQAKIQDMVSCETCGIHIPADEAVRSGDKYYCSREHLPDNN